MNLKKQDLLEKLLKYLLADKVKLRGQKPFAEFLVSYLRGVYMPADEKYPFWRIEDYLPQILFDAFEELRLGTNVSTVKFRKRYEKETRFPVPELLNINPMGSSDARVIAIRNMLHPMMLELIGNKWIPSDIEALCFAEDNLLTAVFQGFLREVFRKGMFALISKNSGLGMKGTLGSVTVFAMTARGLTQVQFVHADGMRNVAFLLEKIDSLGYSTEIQSVYADIHTGCAMIKEATQNWPKDQKAQEQLFVME